MNPTKFCKLIESEQLKHPNKCIYHLSKTHQTQNCAVKKECDRLIAANKKPSQTSNPVSPSTGQLHHITEDIVQDIVFDDTTDVEFDIVDNDTNEDALLYFERRSKHYLHLVKSQSNPCPVSRHDMKFPVIIDSGANYHMFRDKEFFEHLSPATGSVILGDRKTTLAIHGIGTVKCQLGENIVTIPDVRCIPGLSESIYSLFLHIKSPDHDVESSFEDGLYLKFPTFKPKAIIESDDIYLDMIPLSLDTITPSTEQISSKDLSPTMFCRPVAETNQLNEENGQLHSILKELH